MRILALEFIYKNEKRSRKRRGAKCPRRDTQSCGKLFFSDLYRLTKKYKVRLAIKTTIPRMKDYRVSPKKKKLWLSQILGVRISKLSKILYPGIITTTDYRKKDKNLGLKSILFLSLLKVNIDRLLFLENHALFFWWQEKTEWSNWTTSRSHKIKESF